MQDLILNLVFYIGASVAGSFMGLLVYSECRHRQRVNKIRCLVTMDVSLIFKAITNVKNEAYREKKHEQTAKSLIKFLERNIIVIHSISEGIATNLSRQYFHLPAEEMIKLDLIYTQLDKFNKTMKLWGQELNKLKIDEMVPYADDLCTELIKECKKLDEPVSYITGLPWYKKWTKKLTHDSKFKVDA